jgi:hypothetical protein
VQSTIRLFKALPVQNKNTAKNEDLTKATLAKGFVFAPEVFANYPDTTHLIELVNQTYGRNSEELNQAFHKSFAKVRDASIQQLVFEQIIHYLTTYGAESLGIYDQDSVYIPGEQLDAPGLEEGVRLVVIRGLTKTELKERLMHLLSSGVALHERTLADVLDVATFVELASEDIEAINNKEAKAALYDYFGIVPNQPVEFLRFVVYRATESTLLIKNEALICQIKERNNFDISRYFDIYEREVGLHRLAEIFYRYKPIFLAFRTNTNLKRTINKIRRLARDNHKPMQEEFLNSVTPRLKSRESLDLDEFQTALQNASVFRKIRLAHALKFRTTEADSILYRVRNGRSFATGFSFLNQDGAQTTYEITMRSIITDLRSNVAGKKIFIPQGLKYGLPATEKQFTGNLPSGTCVHVRTDMVVGVHWENVGDQRIDLDLSMLSADGKFGWDGSYRDRRSEIYFTGDLTDAPKPNGAAELFHIGSQARGSWLINLNYYNYDAGVPVPFRIVVAIESRENIERNYVIDPNKIVAQSYTEATEKQKNLGLIVADDNGTKFYFAESNLGKSITAGNKAYSDQARRYLLNYYSDSIVLNDVLVAAGAELVDEVAEADIDLSPERVDKTTVLELLTKKTEERHPS